MKSSAWSSHGLRPASANMDPLKTDPQSPDSSESLPGPSPQAPEGKPDPQITSASVKISALMVSIALMAVGLWLLGQNWGRNTPWATWGVLLVGFFLFLTSQRIHPDKQLPEWLSIAINRLIYKFKINGWQLICLLISPVLSLVAFLAAGTGPYMNNPIIAISSWITAIVFIGLAGFHNDLSLKPKTNRIELGLAGLIILIAGIIRGLYLNNIPILLSGDEASSGISAVAFIDGSTNNIFRMGWFSFPAFHNWLQSIPIRFLGQNTPALRLTSVIAGSLTVGVVYFVGKSLINKK